MQQNKTFIQKMADVLIDLRWLWLAILTVITVLLVIQAGRLEQKAGFEKQVPHEHPYMDAYNDWKTTFAGNNRILISLMVREEAEYKDIFNTEFLGTLKKVSDDVSLTKGINQANVKSLFTADRRYIEVTEEGFEGGAVVPTTYYASVAKYEKTCELPGQSVFDRVRNNAFKAADTPGRFITQADSEGNVVGAMVDAEVLERDPVTLVPVDPKNVAGLLERDIREKYENDNISIHIIGFSKVVGDIVDGIGIDKVAKAVASYSNASGSGAEFRESIADYIEQQQEAGKEELPASQLVNQIDLTRLNHKFRTTQENSKPDDIQELEEEEGIIQLYQELFADKILSGISAEEYAERETAISRAIEAISSEYYAEEECYALLPQGKKEDEGFNAEAPFYTKKVETIGVDEKGNETTVTRIVAYKTQQQLDDEMLNTASDVKSKQSIAKQLAKEAAEESAKDRAFAKANGLELPEEKSAEEKEELSAKEKRIQALQLKAEFNQDYWQDQYSCAAPMVRLQALIGKLDQAIIVLKSQVEAEVDDAEAQETYRETEYQYSKSKKDLSAELTKLRAAFDTANIDTDARAQRLIEAVSAASAGSESGDGAEKAATGVMACGISTDNSSVNLAALQDNIGEIKSAHWDDVASKVFGGDGKAGAVKSVVFFFLYTMILAGILLYLYCGSFKLTLVPIVAAVLAVIWQFGMLITLGDILVYFRVIPEVYGIDPMSILVPFLVFAIGVSHGVQMVNSYMEEVIKPGMTGKQATKETLAKLLVPASTALVSDTVGFLTIIVIPVDTIREMAITASMGVGVILVTNLIFLPILLSFVNIKNLEKYTKKVEFRQNFGTGFWRKLSALTTRGPAIVTIIVTALLFAYGIYQTPNVAIGDLEEGVPALSQESVYNRDNKKIVSSFDIGTDIIQIIAEAPKDGCIQYDVMDQIFDFEQYVKSLPGVNTAISAPGIARLIVSANQEGSLMWRNLSRDKNILVGAMGQITSDTGLINSECSAMPIYIFTKDHKADTLEYLTMRIEEYIAGQNELYEQLGTSNVQFSKPPPPRASEIDFVDTIAADVLAKREARKAAKEAERAKLKAEAEGKEPPVEQTAVYDYTQVTFRLATGNAGVEAATNVTVAEAQNPIVVYVYIAIIILCIIMFGLQFKGTAIAIALMAEIAAVGIAFILFGDLAIAALLGALIFLPLYLLLGGLNSEKLVRAGIIGAVAAVVIAILSIVVAGIDPLISLAVAIHAFTVGFAFGKGSKQSAQTITAMAAMLCVVLPLLTVSYLGYAVMYHLGIGLKIATLPVVALGVGIGIDYGIYIFGTMGNLLMAGRTLRESYFETLQLTGKAVLFTAVTLGLGVGTWVFSDLQFQVDMGKMLFFMFFVNMLAAVLVVPALAHFLIRIKPEHTNVGAQANT